VNIATTAPAPKASSADGRRPSLFPTGYIKPFVLVTVLFFIWGMSNNLTDILVQQFKKSFELSPLQAQLVQTAVFLGYFCMALPAALAMRRWGYKAGILGGLCLFGTGTLMFWPAAVVGQYRVVRCRVWLGDAGDSGESVYCADGANGDLGTATEFFASLQPSGDHYRRVDWHVLYLLGC